MLEVTALGAVCESEDLAAPRRVHSDDADQPARFGFVGTVGPAGSLEQERRAMLEAGVLAISAVEFADLSDGTRVVLSTDRGWTHAPREFEGGPWKIASGREITRTAMLTLDPDDSDWEWVQRIVDVLSELGFEVDPTSVHAAPFRVEFGPRLRRELTA